jgi:CrcB protein
MFALFLKFMAVAFGGACGAAARYAISLLPNPLSIPFPIWTFTVNILGAIAIGFIVGHQSKLGNYTMLALKTGFCGGFTTFSTFSHETLDLIDKNHIILAGVYALRTLVACLIGVCLGRKLAA